MDLLFQKDAVKSTGSMNSITMGSWIMEFITNNLYRTRLSVSRSNRTKLVVPKELWLNRSLLAQNQVTTLICNLTKTIKWQSFMKHSRSTT